MFGKFTVELKLRRQMSRNRRAYFFLVNRSTSTTTRDCKRRDIQDLRRHAPGVSRQLAMACRNLLHLESNAQTSTERKV